MCRSQQVLPPDAFGSLVHCLAVIADDLWCALGSGSLVVYRLASREIRIKVLLQMLSACSSLKLDLPQH